MFIGATKKVYRHKKPFLWLLSFIHWLACPSAKSPKTLATPLELGRLGALELKLQFISNEGNELRIGGLSLGIADGVAEEPLQGVQITPIPGYLDGVADGPLYPGWGGAEGFGHLGVEHLGDGIDHVHVVHRDDDGLPQILVALDVGRDADLMDDAGDHGFDAGLVHAARGRKPEALPSPDFLQPLHQYGQIAGLEHQIPNPQIGGCRGYIFRHKGGGRQGDGLVIRS